MTLDAAEIPELDRNRVAASLLVANDPLREAKVDPSKFCLRSGEFGDRKELSSTAVWGGVDMLGPLRCVGVVVVSCDVEGCSERFC